MARKPRDYKAEEARRKELAKQRGFANRYQQRRAIETGKARALNPKRVRSPKTVAAQNRFLGDLFKKKEQKDFGGVPLPSLAQQSRDWSALHSKSARSKYRPQNAAKLGMTVDEYTLAYYLAYVARHDQTPRERKFALRRWMVDINGFVSEPVYDTGY